MGREKSADLLLKLGFTTILLAYFLVWLPQPVVGLSFIGLEVGEWVKFIPAVSSGTASADRNLFYLPPITLALMLLFWSSSWSNRRWQTWVMRVLAICVSLLAFPAIESLLEEPVDQWILRLIWVGIVVLLTVILPLSQKLPSRLLSTIQWSSIAFLGLIGIFFPTWAYLSIRPLAAQVIANSVGFGPGFWLNILGHLLVLIAAALNLRSASLTQSAA